MPSTIDKDALKRLRQQRKPQIERARKVIQEQTRAVKAIKAQLASAPRTVPAIAANLQMDPADVLRYIAALRKYGEVLEDAKDGDYFTYQLVH